MERLQWRNSVPIFRNTIILKQLGVAVGIPLGLAVLIITVTSGRSVYTLYALGLIGALLLLTWLFMMTVYGGRYEVEYLLDEQGVWCRTQTKQAKKNQIINTLTVVMGFLSGKPAVSGAGLLAQSRQEVFLRWSSVRKVAYQPGNRAIMLRGGWTEHIALFCTEEDYSLVEQMVKMRAGPYKPKYK
jgi:hypothetical protein